MKIKKLVWTKENEATRQIDKTHVISSSVLGDWFIKWDDWKEYPVYRIEIPINRKARLVVCDSLKEAKQEAQQIFDKIVMGMIEEG